MKIAVLLSGQPRFTGDFDLLLKNLKGYDQADWFINITKDNDISKDKFKTVKTREDTPVSISILDSWVDFDLDWAKNKIENNLPPNNHVRKIEFSDWHIQQLDHDNFKHPIESNVRWIGNLELRYYIQVIFIMHYNIYKANCLRLQYQKETNTVYDAVIRVRSDVSIKEEFNLKSLKINPNTIYLCNNKKWWGLGETRCNDQTAIGDDHSMNIYCDLINQIKNYNKMIFHPEYILAHHLKFNNIKIEPGGYNTGLREIPADESKWN